MDKKILSNIAKTTSTTAVALALMAGLSAANADEPQFYVSGFGGVVFSSDFESDLVNGPAAGANYDIDLDTGFVVGGALGVRPGLDLGVISPRAEIEFSYSDRNVGDVNFSGNGPGAELNVQGDLTTASVMANLIADIDTGTPFTPYIGGGVGVAFVDYNFQYQTGPLIQVDSEESALAVQGIVGVSYDVSDNVALTLDGRYGAIFGVEIDRFVQPAGVLTGQAEDDITAFAITAGLRYGF